MNTPTINVHSPTIPHQNARIELNREGLAALKAAIGMAEFTAESNSGYGQGLAQVFDSEGEGYGVVIILLPELDADIHRPFHTIHEMF